MSQPPDLKTKVADFRTKMRAHQKSASVVSIGLGPDPSGTGTEEGIVVLYSDPAVLAAVKEVARQTAPGVPVYTRASGPARPQ